MHILSSNPHTNGVSDFPFLSGSGAGLGALLHPFHTRCLDGLQAHTVELFAMCCAGAESKRSNNLTPRKTLTLHNPCDLFLCQSFICTQKRLACG